MNKSIFPLLQGLKTNSFEFPTRIAMAALTRMRCDPNTSIPNDLHVQYYSERCVGAAFVLTECTAIARRGNCFPGAAGIYTQDQVEGWKRVTQAVHDKGGKIFLQIWHCGRSAHSDILDGQIPVAPSKITLRGKIRTAKGLVDHTEPEELNENGIRDIINSFKSGAENALKAGFDGIQLHGANGYIIDQFLRDCTNKRTDIYGGNIENRSRFPLEVVDSLISVFGKDKVGIKLTPIGRYNDMFDSNPLDHFTYFVKELDKRRIAFIEFVEPPEFIPVTNLYKIDGKDQLPNVCKAFRPHFKNLLIANNGYTFETANKKIEDKEADLITFGRSFISNPDLVERFRNGWELTRAKPQLFYGGDGKGYIDYPRYEAKAKL